MNPRFRFLLALFLIMSASPTLGDVPLRVSPSEPGQPDGSLIPWSHRTAVSSLGTAVQNVDTGALFGDIQSAIDDAGTLAGHTLEVVAATHSEGQISVHKSLTLRGTSVATVINMAEDTGVSGDSRAWFLVSPGVDLVVRDLTFDGNGFKVFQAFRHRGTGLFEDLIFRNIQFDASGPNYAGTAIVAFGGRVDVRDTTFLDIGRVGVLAFGPGMTGAEIVNNFYAGKGDGDFLDYGVEVGGGAVVTLRDNTVFDCRGVASQDGSASAGVLVTTASAPGTMATLVGNTLLGNSTGLRTGNAGDTSAIAAHHNRFVTNQLGAFSGSPNVVVERNWWGCNEGPGAIDCNDAGGTLDFDPWLVLSLEGPASVPPSSSALIQADLNRDSDGVDTSAQGFLPDGLLATFGATPGSMAPTSAATAMGAASSTFTADATEGVATVSVNVDNENVFLNIDVSSSTGPTLNIPSAIPARSGSRVAVPIELISTGDIAAVSFSVDSDESCLAFDDTDGNADGIPDDAVFEVAALPHMPVFGMTYDAADTTGEFQFFIADFGAPPLTPLPSGVLITLYFTVTCNPSSSLEAPVLFADDPSASFGDVNGQSVPGTVSHGSVLVFGGLPGDCNGDGVVDAGDLSACPLEIFDGDGSFWADAGGGTFVGDPIGCDANEDDTIDAGDSSCKVLLIFNGPGACAAPFAEGGSPGLRWTDPVPTRVGDVVTITLRLENPGSVSSLALSLDHDETYLRLDPTDADGDGVPDALRVHLQSGGVTHVTYDPEDRGGKIDLALLRPFAALEDGGLLSLDLTVIEQPPRESTDILFSIDPSPSFGALSGRAVAGEWQNGSVSVPTGLLFSDGFELGDLRKWSP